MWGGENHRGRQEQAKGPTYRQREREREWECVEAMSIGLPVKLLHEAEGHVINLELTSGEVYRGHLLDAEDNMNCQLSDVKVIARDGGWACTETCMFPSQYTHTNTHTATYVYSFTHI